MAGLPSDNTNRATVDTIVNNYAGFPCVIAFGLHEVQHEREEK
jgi:hypothetical protein